MPVPQQLSQIPILRTRHPNLRKVIFPHQPEYESRVFTVKLLLLHSLGFDLRRISDPQLETQFSQQPLEPAGISGSLHAYTHADSSLLQVSIEFLCLPITVVQLLVTTLT